MPADNLLTYGLRPLRVAGLGHWRVIVAYVCAVLLAVMATLLVVSTTVSSTVLAELWPVAVLLGICWLAALVVCGEARLRPARTNSAQLLGVVKAIVLGTAAALLIRAALPRPLAFTAAQYGLAMLLAVALAWVGRRLAVAWTPRRCYLVISSNGIARPLLECVQSGEPLGYHEIAGILTNDNDLQCPEVPVFHSTPQWDALAPLARTLGANRVVVDGDPGLSAEAVGGLRRCRDQGIAVLSALSAYEEITSKTLLPEIEGALAGSERRPARSIYDRYLKRVVDIVLTLLLLPLALAIIAVCAIFIKILMPGPVFYRQERVGYRGKRFQLTKLRTMVLDAEKETGPVWAREDDARVTTLGRILRRARIDELPQLFHVLTGEMGLVGPRPERPYFIAEWVQRLSSYHQRSCVLPGITGWAQVNHHYGGCFEDVCEKLRYDLYYIRRRSWALDLDTLRRTVGVIVHGRGAR